jgi:hypothetical protein
MNLTLRLYYFFVNTYIYVDVKADQKNVCEMKHFSPHPNIINYFNIYFS